MLCRGRWLRQLSARRSFSQLGVSKLLVERLRSKDIVTPTDIQTKVLPRVLGGRHVVMNAETGSGKTLCFLLPMIDRLMNSKEPSDDSKGPSNDSKGPSDDSKWSESDLGGSDGAPRYPQGLVLVPTPDLVHQIHTVYTGLCSFECSLLYGDRPLLLTPSVGLLVATPTSLIQYDLYKVLENIGVVCCDEADILLAGGEKVATWKILETIRKLHQRDVRASDELQQVPGGRQLLFSAATLPTNSPKSVGRVLSQWLPKNALFITTEGSHCVVPSATVVFENLDCLPGEDVDSDELFEVKLKVLLKGLSPNNRTMVFCNTVDNCQKLFRVLDSVAFKDLNVATLNKHVLPEQRAQTVEEFNQGGVDVLLCTDLASRGIDLSDVSQVVMFDFPVNSADFLHRAGRTARANKNGKVIAYVGPGDQLLSEEIKKVLQHDGKREEGDRLTFSSLFSRNKMLRRRLKRRENA